MAVVTVNQELCSSCGTCMDICPDKMFQRDSGGVIASTADTCLSCGHCIAVCPTGAVQHASHQIEDCPPIRVSELPPHVSLVLALRERRSCRRFQQRTVPRELVETLIETARWTPSASNSQSTAWLALDDPQRIQAIGADIIGIFERSARLLRAPFIRLLGPALLGRARFQEAVKYRSGLEDLVAACRGGEDRIFYHAPLLLIGHTPTGNNLGRDDAIYQAYNIMLVAQRLGLGTCQIGYLTTALEIKVFGFNHSLVRRMNLPVGRSIQVALVAGYPRYRFRRLVSRRQTALEWNTTL